MKKIIHLLVILISTGLLGQNYITKTGTLDFEASTPAFEPVRAKHNSTTAILDIANGNTAVLALVRGFRFKNALMEEHFNENYMDSETFPKASFTGTIVNFREDNLGAQKEYMVKGKLTIHGKIKEIEAPVTLSKQGDIITMKTKFSVSPRDFDIKIPNVVKDKISDSIIILGTFELALR